MSDCKRLSLVSGLLLVWLFTSTAAAQRLNHNSYLGQVPPEIRSQKDHWLGWHEKVALAGLRGKVVWLQFNFCENCTSLRSHLVEWEKQHKDDGLVVIEINRCIGESLEDMRCTVEFQELKHPVLWDAGCQNSKAYGISAWPFAYLIGTDGRIFWEGNPARWIRCKQEVEKMRERIERELSNGREPSTSSPAARTEKDATRP